MVFDKAGSCQRCCCRPNCLSNLRHFSSCHFTSSCEVQSHQGVMFYDPSVHPYLAHIYYRSRWLRQKSRASGVVTWAHLFTFHAQDSSRSAPQYSRPFCQLDPLIRLCNAPRNRLLRCGPSVTVRLSIQSFYPVFLCVFRDAGAHIKAWSAGGPYEKPGKAPAASLTLLLTIMLSVHREEDTGRWVNSGSKCRRSVGPLCETKREGQELDM